jgi:hypothetical protein
MKNPDFTQNFGDETSVEDINAALQDDSNSISPYMIKQGEFSYIEQSRYIETQQPVVILQRGDTVTLKTEDTTNFYFTVVSELVELINNEMKPSRTEQVVPLSKKGQHAANTVDSMIASLSSPQMSAQSVHKMDTTTDPTAPVKTTYHNFVKDQTTFMVPALVKKRANCGGLAEDICNNGIPANRIRFDKVDWDANGVGNKMSVEVLYSKNVPYFSSQLQSCLSTSIPVADQRVKITQCSTIVDFTFGHD